MLWFRKKDSGAETFLETYSSLKEALDEVDPIKFGQLMKKRSLKKAVKIWLTFIVASEIRKHNIGVAEGIALVERKYGIGTALILEDEVSSLVSCWNIEFSPVCSIVGGLLAQEILKSATKDSHPLKNFVVFDGLTTAACVLDISPEPSPRPHLKRKL